jgi:hypothetical protein
LLNPFTVQVAGNTQAHQFRARRINAKTISSASSHASMVSHATEIADLILSAAKELESATIEEAAMH